MLLRKCFQSGVTCEPCGENMESAGIEDSLNFLTALACTVPGHKWIHLVK
jgi:hypothetical protein